MENFKVAVLLIALRIACADVEIEAKDEISDDLFNECFPHTKMCEVNATKCFSNDAPLIRSRASLVKDCDVRQNYVYQTNQRRKFNISIRPWNLEYFPPNITYSVYRKRVSKSKGGLFWDEPLEPVKGCLDMTLSKTCFLPKYDEHYKLIAIIPMATKRSDRPWYGVHRISEINGLLHDCEEEKPVTTTCFNYTNGRTYIEHSIFQPLSDRVPPKTLDYCFFAARERISNLVLHNNTHLFKRSTHFPHLKEGKNCSVVIGARNDEKTDHVLAATRTNISTEVVICYMFRIKTLSEYWQNDVRCMPGKKAKTTCDYRKDVYFYATLGAIVCLMAILVFIAGCCFKRYIMKKIEMSIPSTFIVAKTTYFNEKAPHDDSSPKEEAFPIEMYFPMEGLADENEHFPAKLDPIEKNQIWSSDDVSVSLAEEGIYCKKFDMRTDRLQEDVITWI